MQSRHSLPVKQNTQNEIRLAPAREALRRRLESPSFKRRRKAARLNAQRRILQLTLALLCLTAMLSFARLSSASVALRVDEAATRMALRGGQAEVSLAVKNPSAQSFAAKVVCELLDTDDTVRAGSEREEWIRPGGASLRIALAPSLTGDNEESLEKFLWYRLRYRITPLRTASAPVGPIEGVISLSEITPDFFDLRVSAPYYARESALCHARVRAVHPISQKPVAGVNVTAEIKFDEDESVKASGVTGPDGYAAIVFNMPPKITSDEADLKITARLGDFDREAESEINFDRDARILINTDKPLYQPGQTIHVRALVFNAHKRVAANTPLTLTIYDVEDSLLFRTELVTTRFGVASAGWAIPENTRLGDYRISIKPEDEGFSTNETHKSVKVSRYDLPNFTVNPKPDKPYYLPGQDAEVEVRAAYLFGQPVKRGHVRVVRETERRWNYQEQKWETEETEEYEGETDDAGQFTARINLAEEHQELSKSDWTKFLDLSYAAYFTDPTTNRTEQRRFDLRITKHAIHIYLVKDNYYQTNGFPTQFYLSASYADGTPAACEVTINKKKERSSAWPRFSNFTKLSSAHASSPVNRRVVTNRFGVAKVENLTLLGLKDDEEAVSLAVEARDAKGLTGSESIEFEHSDKPQVRVMTEKPLYRKGEAVRALITGSEPEMTVIVDVVRDWRVIRSEIVRLKQGRALFTVPYDEHFKGEVSIIAYYDRTDSERHYDSRAARTVLYPNDESLKLDVRLDRSTYRPGEEARADFQVQASDGRPVESALGVLVFDRAVEERARTDAEFGGNRSYGFRLHSASDAIAGLRLEDFARADRARPLPAGLELVAEVLLAHSGRYSTRIFGSEEYDSDQRKIFSGLVEAQLKPVKHALETRYNRNREYPTDERELLTLLSSEEVDFKGMRDPWGTPYRTGFGWSHDEDVLDIMSAGADKRFSSPDDFVALRVGRPYFHALGEKLNRAVANYHQRTNKYIRDAATFKEELRREGVDFDSLRDKRGKPYQIDFEGAGSEWLVVVKSSNTTDTTDPRGQYVPKEFKVWTARMDYFSEIRERIYSALTMHLQATMRAPLSEAEVFDALHRAGFTDEELRDPWGRRFQITLQSWVRNTDRVSILHRAKYGEPLTPQIERTPVSRQFYLLTISSAGKDGRAGTADDFKVTTFYRTTYELDFLPPAQPQSLAAKSNMQAPHIPGRAGNLQGVVFDPNRAVIPGAIVRVINTETGMVREVTTNDEGFYRITNLLPGERYSIEANAPGFLQTIIERVPVRAWAENNLDFYMAVGAVGETVMVTAESPMLQSTQSQLSVSYTPRQLTELPFNGSIDNLALLSPGSYGAEFGRNSGAIVNVITKSGTSHNYQPDGRENLSASTPAGQISTPRLREYFPETLVWQPLLETDASGRAQLAFKLADNITTWKMSVIGSTFDGEIGIAEREIQSFQPFFVEHDPPRILTEGDQIQLPVVLRNYLAQEQAVRVEMKPEAWFNLLGPAELTEKVAAGDATRAIFGFRAAASVKDGKQRITATGADANDAIEKPVSVHPDGEEVTKTFSHLMTETATFDVNFPGDAVTGSTAAELKIYPNLMAHIIEGIEGIMRRPYGCGEQTVSSTYPSLLALRAHKASNISSPVSAKAARFLRVGYERLLNYREPGGGFSYWGRGEANLALSAYALRFLNDAREFTPVDESALKETREWLIKQQDADGSWGGRDYGMGKQGTARAMLTAYIARVLAVSQLSSKQNQTAAAENPTAASLTRALNYLQPQVEKLDEPYLIAAYALAAMEANEPQRAAQAVTRLRSLAQHDGELSFWSSETTTPFYGWGLAGRIETTALAVQALTRFYAPATNELPERGLAYLLSMKDRYGVWYSTQATVNVHDALIKAMTKGHAADSQAQEDRAEIFVNEQSAASVMLPPAGQLSAPISFDLSPYLAAGNNRVQIRRAAARGPAALQIVATYYLPWNSPATSIANPSAASRTLRLAVSYDKTETEIGAQVTCRVEAARTNLSGGYGMMLAEIGLPPGAEVDRASLEEAMNKSGWSLSRYDILPDKLIVYLWPQTGGTRFEFKFRARYGLTAQTAPSVLYDYYNPEARTVIAPTRFAVR
jgi:uncharacterized protein YfaS (alpha-2-macroglobulin family)